MDSPVPPPPPPTAVIMSCTVQTNAVVPEHTATLSVKDRALGMGGLSNWAGKKLLLMLLAFVVVVLRLLLVSRIPHSESLTVAGYNGGMLHE